jgi:two-component system, chemotaxis family, CheB/CheR fusion protein
VSEEKHPDLGELLNFLKTARGLEFSGYKPASLERRIHKRMQTVNATNYGEYIEYLEVHPDEFTELFTTILINVTSFFRDQPAWDFLNQEILPRIITSGQRICGA